MTITYQSEVATGSLSGFAKLLLKWRGSVYKLLYKEMLLFSACYAIISISYRVYLNEVQRTKFEKVALYCSHYIDLIPLSFVLGFYVTFVVQRWWTQFITIPFPDRMMNLITLYVSGEDERGRLIRRTLMRYWNLSFVLMMRSISVAVKKRFPTLAHLVGTGYMTEEEYNLYESTQIKVNKFWIPMTWFIKLLDVTRSEGRTKEGAAMKHIMEELNDCRNNLKLLWCHDWVTVPLVYTQVVTWATHLFFLVSLIGRQFLDPSKNYPGHEVDVYIPFFTLMQFLFYMGWLKVAEQLINPFGEDDDDIECNWLIDRHIQVSYLGVDELYTKAPSLQKDMYWDERQPNVPYTEAALMHKIPYYNGSTVNVKVDSRKQSLIHAASVVSMNISNVSEKKKPGCWCFAKSDKQTTQEENKGPHFYALGKSHPLTQRTLGRRETLMAEELLAMLNSGKYRQEDMKKKLSDHIETLAANDCVVEIEEDDTGASGDYVLKESYKMGRFIISRTNSTGSIKSNKGEGCAYINPVAINESLNNMYNNNSQNTLEASDGAQAASNEAFNRTVLRNSSRSREQPILSSVTEVDEEIESSLASPSPYNTTPNAPEPSDKNTEENTQQHIP